MNKDGQIDPLALLKPDPQESEAPEASAFGVVCDEEGGINFIKLDGVEFPESPQELAVILATCLQGITQQIYDESNHNTEEPTPDVGLPQDTLPN